jgi:phosphonate transport system substrate-binding protein
VAGHTFAYSDPASTSGHLFPAYALKNVGIDPDHGVRAIYAGSHTASYEALLHHKVEAGEINSPEILSAQRAGIYKPSDFVTLWTSPPIPDDPITVRSNLPPAFKAKLTEVLQTLDLSSIPASELKITGLKGKGYVAIDDHAYDGIRSLVSVLHLDLAKMGS